MTSPRQSIATLCVSAACLVGIAVHESYTQEAVIPVPGDRPTIGFGNANGVKMGDKTTPPRALVQLDMEAEQIAQDIKKCIDVPLYQREFDAYLDLAYNIGASAFCKSTIVKRLKAGDYAGACDAILPFDKFHGRTLNGLTKRRLEEYKLCMGAA